MLLRFLLCLAFSFSFCSAAYGTRYESNSSGTPRKISGSGVRVQPMQRRPRVIAPPSPPPSPRAKAKPRVIRKAKRPKRRVAIKSPPRRPRRRVVKAKRPSSPRQQYRRPIRPAKRSYQSPVVRAPKQADSHSRFNGLVRPLSPSEANQFIPRPVRVIHRVQERSIWPLLHQFRISSPFGWRIHPVTGQRRLHAGTDIAAPQGSFIRAVYSGHVVSSGRNGGYGLSILIEHSGGQIRTRYGHLSQLLVHAGADIVQGTVIGKVGSTGLSTGPHLHIERLERQGDGTYQAVDFGDELKVALVRMVQARHLAKQQQ